MCFPQVSLNPIKKSQNMVVFQCVSFIFQSVSGKVRFCELKIPKSKEHSANSKFPKAKNTAPRRTQRHKVVKCWFCEHSAILLNLFFFFYKIDPTYI